MLVTSSFSIFTPLLYQLSKVTSSSDKEIYFKYNESGLRTYKDTADTTTTYEWDEETGFYYLQSRYYDSEICRFINADDVKQINVGDGVFEKDNLYILQ